MTDTACSQVSNAECLNVNTCSYAATTPSYLLKNDVNATEMSISNDGTNLYFDTDTGVGYFTGDVSATDFINRTSVYDKTKGKALDWVKDASAYKNMFGKIDHTRFYGFKTMTVPDTSKPEKKTECVLGAEEDGKSACLKFADVTFYPETKEVQGVSMSDEIDVLRQALFELKTCIAESKDYATMKACAK